MKNILFTLSFPILLLTYAVPTSKETAPAPVLNVIHDARRDRLIQFFQEYKCPEENYQLIDDYISSADKYNIPYTLLPAISVAESSCLKHYPLATNNPFGYGSATGLYKFESLPAGIAYITERLANAKPYAQKTSIGKLRSYGPQDNPKYAPNVYKLMQQIDESN